MLNIAIFFDKQKVGGKVRFFQGKIASSNLIIAALVWTFFSALLLWRGLCIMEQGLWKSDLLYTCIALSLLLGWIKGHFVLRRAALKLRKRALLSGKSTSFLRFYPRGYYILYGAMMSLGIGLKYSRLPLLWRGVCTFGVAMALLYAVPYLFAFGKEECREKK